MAGLTLAAHGTDTVLISSWKIVEKIEVIVGGTKIKSKRAIKHLGAIINDSLNSKQHMKFIGEKASVTPGVLMRMMPNIGGHLRGE